MIEVDAASGQEQGEAAREQISLAPEDILVRISAREGFAVEAAAIHSQSSTRRSLEI